jgi:hypothetical protein
MAECVIDTRDGGMERGVSESEQNKKKRVSKRLFVPKIDACTLVREV